MADWRVDAGRMEGLGYGPGSYSLTQMIVGAILTELGERGLGLDQVHDDISAEELGQVLEHCARESMAGDGVVRPARNLPGEPSTWDDGEYGSES